MMSARNSPRSNADLGRSLRASVAASEAALVVLLICNRVHMCWIDALPISAEVVEEKALWDRPD